MCMSPLSHLTVCVLLQLSEVQTGKTVFILGARQAMVIATYVANSH